MWLLGLWTIPRISALRSYAIKQRVFAMDGRMDYLYKDHSFIVFLMIIHTTFSSDTTHPREHFTLTNPRNIHLQICLTILLPTISGTVLFSTLRKACAYIFHSSNTIAILDIAAKASAIARVFPGQGKHFASCSKAIASSHILPNTAGLPSNDTRHYRLSACLR